MKLLPNPFTTLAATRSTAETNVRLHKWNRNLALIYGLQAVVLLLLSTAHSLPVTASFLSKDTIASTVAGHMVLAPAAHVLFDLNLAQVVALFLLVSALLYLLQAIWFRERYEAGLKQGLHRLRYVDYILSGGVLLIAVALASGVYDIVSLGLIFALGSLLGFAGLSMESQRKPDSRSWLAYWVGVGAATVVLLVIAVTMLMGAVFGTGAASWYVYVGFIVTALFLAGVATNLYLQIMRRGQWANYAYSERSFMLLSVVAKSLLAWVLFAGVLHA